MEPRPDDEVDDLDIVTSRRGRRGSARWPGDRMRRGARTLRWCALLLATITVVGQWLTTYTVDEGQQFPPYESGWPRFGQFLSGLSWSLGFAGLVLAASFVVTAYAAQLDLEQIARRGLSPVSRRGSAG